MEEDKGDKEQCYKIMKKPSNALRKCSYHLLKCSPGYDPVNYYTKTIHGSIHPPLLPLSPVKASTYCRDVRKRRDTTTATCHSP